MDGKKLFCKNISNTCPCIFVALGFVILLLLSWLGEFFDFPHLFFYAPETPFNWREAIVESFLIMVIGTLTVLKLQKVFVQRLKAEKEL